MIAETVTFDPSLVIALFVVLVLLAAAAVAGVAMAVHWLTAWLARSRDLPNARWAASAPGAVAGTAAAGAVLLLLGGAVAIVPALVVGVAVGTCIAEAILHLTAGREDR